MHINVTNILQVTYKCKKDKIVIILSIRVGKSMTFLLRQREKVTAGEGVIHYQWL